MTITETSLQSNIAKYRASFSLDWHKQYRAECQPKQMKLLRDLRKLYKITGINRWCDARRVRFALIHPSVRRGIDTMSFDKHSTWSGIKTDISVLYNDRQRVIDAIESLGYRFMSPYIEKGTRIPRFGYTISQSYWVRNGRRDMPLTNLDFYDLSIRQYFTPTEQCYDTYNPLLTMCEFSILEFPKFDKDGYLIFKSEVA